MFRYPGRHYHYFLLANTLCTMSCSIITSERQGCHPPVWRSIDNSGRVTLSRNSPAHHGHPSQLHPNAHCSLLFIVGVSLCLLLSESRHARSRVVHTPRRSRRRGEAGERHAAGGADDSGVETQAQRLRERTASTIIHKTLLPLLPLFNKSF